MFLLSMLDLKYYRKLLFKFLSFVLSLGLAFILDLDL